MFWDENLKHFSVTSVSYVHTVMKQSKFNAQGCFFGGGGGGTVRSTDNELTGNL